MFVVHECWSLVFDPAKNKEIRMRRWVYSMLVALLVLTGTGVYVYDQLVNDFSSLNHYEALGLSPTASTLEIKRAFRELSLRYHPDKASSELNTRRFHRISDAAQVLSNDETRHAYNLQLQDEQRIRAYQRDAAWQRLRIFPQSRNFSDIVTFYVTEFPWHVVSLAVQLLDLHNFVAALIVLGGAIFVFDLFARLVKRVVRLFRPSDYVAVPKQLKDESLRAARARQQQALQEQAAHAQAQLRQRRLEARLTSSTSSSPNSQ